MRDEAEVQLLRSKAWTPADWADFAATLAEGAYRDGYRRGREEGAGLVLPAASYEWNAWEPEHMRAIRARQGDPGDPLAGVTPEHALALLDALGRHHGTYRVVIDATSATDNRLSVARGETDGDGTKA